MLPDGEWAGAVTLAGASVTIDLAMQPPPTHAKVDPLAKFPQHLARFDALARAAMVASLDDDEGAGLYVSHHLAEIPPKFLATWFPGKTPTEVDPKALRARMT